MEILWGSALDWHATRGESARPFEPLPRLVRTGPLTGPVVPDALAAT
jgi:hypothetical protein